MGDYQKKLSVKTVTRPRMENLTSIVKFPKYLSRNSEKLDSLNKQIKVPENSEITLLGKANRKINQVLIFRLLIQVSVIIHILPTLNLISQLLNKIVNIPYTSSIKFGFSPREPIIISQKIQKDLPPS